MAAFNRPFERPESQLSWRNHSSKRICNVMIAASTSTPQKTHFPTSPKPAILRARPRAARSFASSIRPLSSAAPANAVLLHLGFGKIHWIEAPRMCFINLHSLQPGQDPAEPPRLAVQHDPG